MPSGEDYLKFGNEEYRGSVGHIQNVGSDLVRLGDPNIGQAFDIPDAALELHRTEGAAKDMTVCGDPVDHLFFGVAGIPVFKFIDQVFIVLVGGIAVADIQWHIIDIHGEGHQTDITGLGVLHHRQVAAHPVDGVFKTVFRQQLIGIQAGGAARAAIPDGMLAGKGNRQLQTMGHLLPLGCLIQVDGDNVLGQRMQADLMPFGGDLPDEVG